MTKIAVTPLRILLVDASELFRRGVRTVLAAETESPMTVVAEAGDVAQAIAECLRTKPDLVLLEIRLPDGSGFDVCRHILRQLPDTRIIMLTSDSNDNYVDEAVTSGAHGYLTKEIDPRGLVRALNDVAAGRSILDSRAADRVSLLLRDRPDTEAGPDLSVLSPQERRVLALVADGMTNKEIGEKLGLAENTVKNYLVNAFGKLKVKRRAQAAALFVQQANPK